ncbi:hypothetical protein BDN72DRAFT_878426 [Pluteus cervinus]|uniref:Uncharacterized protein n=1 Tax=Pluteus cervinus TaxID=181527 RepID=A0ACD3AW02_9AGAR|nr:hypothetical protein BDN72DRAFT_878426 [Pluteus cervinus]
MSESSPVRYTPYVPPFFSVDDDVDFVLTNTRDVHEHPPIPTERSKVWTSHLSSPDSQHPVLTRSSLTISTPDPNLAEGKQPNHQPKNPPNDNEVTRPDSPFKRLPVELICSIFELATSTDYKWFSQGLGFDDTASAVICPVCSQWNRDALTIPEVWATMTVSKPRSRDVKLTTQYLKRATAPHNLNLTMYTENQIGAPTPDLETLQASEEILSLWTEAADRWRHVDITIFGSLESPALNKLCQSGIQLPHLRSLKLSTGWSDAMNQRFIHFILSSSPNLQVIRLQLSLSQSTNVYALTKILGPSGGRQVPTDNTISMRAPIPSLHDVFLSTLSPADLADTLHILPNLRHLGIGLTFPYGTPRDEPYTGEVVHEHLVSLRCARSTNLNIANYLGRMTLKSLKELHLCRVDPGFDNSILKNFLARSGCHLTMLHLGGQENKIIEVLTEVETELPELQICRLSTQWTPNQLTNATLEVFAPKADGTIPFPSLVNLSLLYCQIEDGLISGFLEKRYVPGARANIEVVEVQTECWNHKKDVKCFDKAIKEGKLKKYSLIFPVNHEEALHIEET